MSVNINTITIDAPITLGLTGPQGIQGIQGIQGEQGVGVFDQDLNTTDTVAFANLSGTNTGDQSDAEIKTAYENNSDTNAFTDAEKTNLGNQSNTNTGDQDLTALTAHVADVTGNPHNVTKAIVGLTSVDDTSDADKPVSTATQTALDLKADDFDQSLNTTDSVEFTGVALGTGVINQRTESAANPSVTEYPNDKDTGTHRDTSNGVIYQCHNYNGAIIATLIREGFIPRVEAMNPLLATDPLILSGSQAGRPVPQGEALEYTGTEYHTSNVMAPISGGYSAWFNTSSTVAQQIIGAQSTTRAYMIISALGVLAGGVGNDTFSLIKGTTLVDDGAWHFAELSWDGVTVTLKVDGNTEYTGAQNGATPQDFDLDVAARNNNGTRGNTPFIGKLLDVRIIDTTPQHWDRRNNGLSAIGGDNLTLVNNPAAVIDQTIPVDPANERGLTVGTGSNGAPIGEIILARADTPLVDVQGNVTEFPGSTYPLLPDITGGTAEALTAFNTNLASDGNQPPAIFNSGIPATWVHADGSVTLLQVKDNGDSTSSLALGFEDAPTAPEQLTIDEYYD